MPSTPRPPQKQAELEEAQAIRAAVAAEIGELAAVAAEIGVMAAHLASTDDAHLFG